jgi:hypothetical protein
MGILKGNPTLEKIVYFTAIIIAGNLFLTISIVIAAIRNSFMLKIN